VYRRDFITLLGGAAAAWPLAARAQQAGGIRRIGVLMNFRENDPEAGRRVAAFQLSLQQLGWSDGGNIRIEYRWTGSNPDSLQGQAIELVRAQPDVIVANASQSVTELKRVTSTVPIVFVQVAEPVSLGFVASLARPGGNVTGFMNFEPSMGGKWLELLKELSPQVTRVALIYNPDTAPARGSFFVHSVETAAPSFGIETFATSVHDAAEIEHALSAFAREPNGCVIVLPDQFTTNNRGLIIALVARHRLPAIYPFRYFVADGGLMAYGIDSIDLYRRAASYVDRILRGAKAGDLPVQAPTKFELVFNLRTAKASGLTVSESFLLRADEVIE
jgi:putative ABC transport system substrate-binding protein